MIISADQNTASQLAHYAACVFELATLSRSASCRRSRASGTGQQTLPAWRCLCSQHQQGENIYAGVNPRLRRGGKVKDDVALARCLPADFDDVPTDEVQERLASSGLPQPTLTVASGHGVHAYWRLIEPLPDLGVWTTIEKRLIAKLDSDPTIHDPPRILRLPGFKNCKEEPFVPCEIIEAEPTRRCAIDAITTLLPELPTQFSASRPVRRSIELVATNLPDDDTILGRIRSSGESGQIRAVVPWQSVRLPQPE